MYPPEPWGLMLPSWTGTLLGCSLDVVQPVWSLPLKSKSQPAAFSSDVSSLSAARAATGASKIRTESQVFMSGSLLPRCGEHGGTLAGMRRARTAGRTAVVFHDRCPFARHQKPAPPACPEAFRPRERLISLDVKSVQAETRRWRGVFVKAVANALVRPTSRCLEILLVTAPEAPAAPYRLRMPRGYRGCRGGS